MERDVTLPPEEISLTDSGKWSQLPVIAGVGGLVLLAVSYFFGKDVDHGHQLPYSYLVGFVYWLTVALGALFFVLVHYLARSGWSVVIRRLAEHASATMPLFAVLFVPIVFWSHDLYHWMHTEEVAHDAILQHKSPYLNETGFLVRAVVYFVIWTVIAYFFRSRSQQQDKDGDPGITRTLMTSSAPGTILFGLCLAFASYDWVMSLEPHWFSTMFGPYVFAGSAVTIYAFLILVCQRLQGAGLLKSLVTEEHYHDLGKMLFGFVVFWAYLGFSQFMLIWYANIPEETLWFDMRWQDPGWQKVSIFLAAAHFFVPFFWLITQPAKRTPWRLGAGAAWMLFMHLVDVYWMIMPTLHKELHFSWLDVTCWLGIGGLFFAFFALLMKQKSLVPVRDPRLAESLAFQSV
jgi:hypothetical protein